MTHHWRRTVGSILLIGVLVPALAGAMCNAIPTPDRTFTSTKGAVDRPYASPGREVKISLGACDGGAVFIPGATTIALTFHPPAPTRAETVVLPTSSIVDMRTNEVTFIFPDTRELLGALRTGPSSIAVSVENTVVADIGELGSRDASCGALKPHPIFRMFTALPPSNKFHCVAEKYCEDSEVDPSVVRATVDDAGNLLVPWDWGGVFPPGQGSDPIARLVRAGQSGLEAFPPPDPRAGTGIIIPSASYVSSHTLTGGVLPPFLDVGPAAGDGPFPGSTLVGTVDSFEGVLRIAATVGNDPAIFDVRTRLVDGIGPIVITFPSAVEEPLVDLRSVRASGSVTALEEFGHGTGTAGLLLYDNRTGRLGRISAAEGEGQLPRRVAVTDELAAFYDVATDLTSPDLTVFPVALLPVEGEHKAADVADAALIPTGLFGSAGTALPPRLGPGIVGGFAGAARAPTLYDVDAGLTRAGRPVGGADLVEEVLGIRHRRAPERFAAFGGELAPLGAGTLGHVFAVGNRAVFLVCDGACVDGDGRRRDTALMLLEPDGALHELARNPGAPFVFTGSLVGLATHEDARYGGGDSGVADLDGDGKLDGVFLTLYDLEGRRRLLPTGPNGGLVRVPADGVSFVAGVRVIVLGIDEADAGPLNCDGDQGDRVVAILNGRTGQLLNTREPMTGTEFSAGRGLLTFLQPEDIQGRALGATFLNVMRDSDGDEVPDPYDRCPLVANLDQSDADQDGNGDACDAACTGESCAPGRAVSWPTLAPAERLCLRRVGRVTRLLVNTALEADIRCLGAPSCPGVAGLWRRTIGQARRMLARCDAARLDAVGMCASTIDALVARAPGAGCLATAAATAVRSMASARHDGAPATDPRSCGRKLDKAMVRYAKQRHQRVARCQDRFLRGVVPRYPNGTPLASPKECDREEKVAAALARLGRQVRARIARACDPAALADLGVCGGLRAPTLDALVSPDGSGGCLVSSHRSAIDRVLVAALGTTAGAPEVSATAVPCPPLPSPSPTPVVGPHSIQVRLLTQDGAGRVSDIDVGWTGLAHDIRGLAGGGFDATLACSGPASSCPFFAAGDAIPFAAPLPLSAGGVAVCAVLQVDGEIVGSFDTANGALDAELPLSLAIHLGIDLDLPCPACVTPDGKPNLGELGTCSGGPRGGAACRVGGLGDPEFGIAAGTSNDCPITGGLLTRTTLGVTATTETISWGTTPESPSCVAAPGRKCHCRGEGRLGQLQPNACRDDTSTPIDGDVCQPLGGGEGHCPETSDTICADAPWRGCFEARDCPSGACVSETRKCFLDPIVREGRAVPPSGGVAHPTLVGRFCFPSAEAAAVNSVAGFPGPAAFVIPAEVRFER